MFTLKKAERLRSKKTIQELFLKGETILVYPLKAVYLDVEALQGYPAQAAFSVSKKNYKKAVERNLIKRRVREAYRLKKPSFYKKLKSRKVAVMFIYIAKENLPYSDTEKALKKVLKKIVSSKK